MTTKTPTVQNHLTDAKTWIEAAEEDLQKHDAGEKPGDSDAAKFFGFSGAEYTYADIAKGKIEQAQASLQKAVESCSATP